MAEIEAVDSVEPELLEAPESPVEEAVEPESVEPDVVEPPKLKRSRTKAPPRERQREPPRQRPKAKPKAAPRDESPVRWIEPPRVASHIDLIPQIDKALNDYMAYQQNAERERQASVYRSFRPF